jgi:hypothetical protein
MVNIVKNTAKLPKFSINLLSLDYRHKEFASVARSPKKATLTNIGRHNFRDLLIAASATMISIGDINQLVLERRSSFFFFFFFFFFLNKRQLQYPLRISDLDFWCLQASQLNTAITTKFDN